MDGRNMLKLMISYIFWFPSLIINIKIIIIIIVTYYYYYYFNYKVKIALIASFYLHNQT